MGELVALPDRDVNFEQGVVRVVETYNELSTGVMHLGPPQSAAGLRVVAIS